MAYVILEILKIDYFSTLWACPGVPGHAHPKYDNLLAALMELYLLAKSQNNNLRHCGENENWLFQHALGMPRHAWPHPPKI